MKSVKIYNIRKTFSTSFAIVGLFALTTVSGCHVNGHYNKSVDTSRYSEAASSRQNITKDNAKEAIALYERLYSRNGMDDKIAVKYAEALRKGGFSKQAVVVLSPFVDKKINVSASALLEYAAVNIEIGYFLHAQSAVDRFFALKGKKSKELLPKANNLQGLLLSMSGKYEEAEGYYNQALEGWKGDPAPVMNNLALCLAEQGHFDRSIEMLRKAAGLSNSPELFENNIKLVETLRSSVLPAE